MIKPWAWVQTSPESLTSGRWELRDGHGRPRANVWKNSENRFTWHTWNERGTGGENSETTTLNAAKDESVAALVRQGWAPGGWTVQW